MIREFVESFELFGRAYATGWLAAACLALAGTFVVAARQSFVGVVAGQAAACGIAVGGLFGAGHGGASLAWAACAAAGTAAALGAAKDRGQDALAAAYVVLGAGTVAAAALQPAGMELVQSLFAVAVFGATEGDLAAVAACLGILGPPLVLARRRLLLCLAAPESARVEGLRPGLTNALAAAGWAVAVAAATRACGLLFALAMLILPALAARAWVRRFATLLVAAPVLALGATTTAYAAGLAWDLPFGPLAALVLAPLLAAAWWRRGG